MKIFICEKCGKKTNYSFWIIRLRKTALCSKDYKKWLEIKRKYYEKAAVKIFGN